MNKLTLSKSVNLLLLAFAVIGGLYFGRAFLIPVAFAAIISMLLLPLCERLEARNISRGAAGIVCLLVFILSIAAIISLLIWQVSDLAKDFSQVQQKGQMVLDELKTFINAKLGISEAQQQKIIKEQQQSGKGFASGAVSAIMGILVDIILVLVYTFLFLYLRTKIKTFFKKITPAADQDKTDKIISDSTKVAHKYLTGMFMMIVMLWILYGIGFSVAGVPNAVFFAILCGILEIVPFIGNLTGSGITLLMALSSGGTNAALGVVITYCVVQFLQTYIIEPLVVGGEVNINPLFTIMALVLGEQIWGIAGMILAIPLLGITKIFLDNVDALKAYGYLIGGQEKKGDPGFLKKIKSRFNSQKGN